MWFARSPLFLVFILLHAVQALTLPQYGFTRNVLQVFINVHDAQTAPASSWQWPWQSGDNTFERFWNDLPHLYNKAMAFAQHERDEFVKSHPDVLSKMKQLEQAGKDLMHATSQFDVAHLDEDGTLAEKWSLIVETVYAKLQEEFPAPDKAPSHAERKEVVGRALVLVEDQFVIFMGPHLGMNEKDIREKFGKVREAVEKVVVLIGDLIEQHPIIAGMIFFGIAALILPEIPILRPILGFTAEGPGKGSIAAWTQRRFYGAYIPKGSLFSMLQKANAGTLKWVSNGWKWIGSIGFGGGIGGSIALCGGRRRS